MTTYHQGFLSCLESHVVKRRRHSSKNLPSSNSLEIKPKKLFAINFHRIPLIVFDMGHMVIGIDDAQKALEILNLIKYNLYFMGYRYSYTVRLDALREVGFTPSFKYDFSQLDIDPCTTHINFGITESTLKKSILKSIEISKKPELIEQFRLLSDSQRHIDNMEFSASFLLSYLILEQELYRRWDEKIRRLNLQQNRMSQLLDHNKIWQTSRVIEIANLLKIIDDTEYGLLNKFRIIRNNLAHNGTNVNDKDAHNCFVLAENLIHKKVNKLSIPDVKNVTWH